jgi:hypothetical protein
LKEETEEMGDKIKFGKIENNKLFASIIREDGKIDKVYWNLDPMNNSLSSVWYYPVEK